VVVVKVYRDEIENNSAVRPSIIGPSGINQYSIELRDQSGSGVENRVIIAHDMRSLIKSCETLAFLVRDAAHITPHNFAACVHTIRTFVVASVDGGELSSYCVLDYSLLVMEWMNTTLFWKQNWKQESLAIVKMNARCTLYMDWTPWKILGVPGYAHGYFSRNC